MGATLAHGVRAGGPADGWVVALADMPFIRPETIADVAERIAKGAALVAPVYHGERGHPVGFGAGYHDRLAALSGDEGARAIVRADAGLLIPLEADDPGVIRDIDTPADLPPA